MEKLKPQRMCIACRQMKDKHELIRIVKNAEGEINLDFTSKMSGRGAYICNDPSCIQKCVKQRSINRAFKCEVNSLVYEKLLKDFSGGKG